MNIRPIAGGSGEEEGEDEGHQIEADDLIRKALEEKQRQEAGEKPVLPNPPNPAKPAPAQANVAWFLAERDVKKSCPALDADDIALLKAASGDDPVKFVELAEKQQAKREALLAVQSKAETEQDELRRRAAEEILSGGGPGGSGSVRPKEPTPAEKVKEAVEKGDSHGIQRAMVEVINTGKDGKPIFSGVRISEE